MTREELNDRKREVINSLNSIADELKSDLRMHLSEGDSFESIIADVENNISVFERIIDEFNAELNYLEDLQDEEILLEEGGK